MKIIGKTTTGFILEAPTDEVFNLIGYSSEWYGDRDKARLIIGSEVNVAGMYEALYSLQHAVGIISDLKAKAGNLINELGRHPAVPILEGVKVGPDKKEETP